MRLSSRRRPSHLKRALAPRVDALEARELLSANRPLEAVRQAAEVHIEARQERLAELRTTLAAGRLAHYQAHHIEHTQLKIHALISDPNPKVHALVQNPTPPAGAYAPAQIEQAYGFNGISFGSTAGDGTGQTIAIVDAYDDPSIQADLNVFDQQYNLPATTVTRLNETGGTSLPATDSTGGWELEESLDVEWAHAIAPKASILLVEASSASDADLLSAVDTASARAGVVSLSWGGSEFSSETSSTYENHFIHPGVVYVNASGDDGAPASWPGVSPDVLAVGGTSLTLDANNNRTSETGWSGSGGGPSSYESQPSYQTGVVKQTTTKRANPDVSYDADPNTGYAVYDSFNYENVSYGWIQIGGTSAAAPQWAALIAIADQGLALNGSAALDTSGPEQVQSILYNTANAGDFYDVTSGTSTGSPRYSAATGYDYVTGLGVPKANLIVATLDGATTVTPPGPPPVAPVTVADFTFETGGANTPQTAQGWTFNNAVGAPASGLWHVSGGRANNAGHSANFSLYYGQNETINGGGTYQTGSQRNAGNATSPAIDLTKDTAPSLSFNYLLQTESSTAYDKAQVQVSSNGGSTWTTVADRASGTLKNTAGKFVTDTVSLAAYAHSTILVRLSFDTVDGYANNYEGWYVDDVTVTGTPG